MLLLTVSVGISGHGTESIQKLAFGVVLAYANGESAKFVRWVNMVCVKTLRASKRFFFFFEKRRSEKSFCWGRGTF